MLLGVFALAGCSDDPVPCTFDSDCNEAATRYCDRERGVCAERSARIDAFDPDVTEDAEPDVPPPEEICDNERDDDGDGAVDCADGECFGSDACALSPVWVAYVTTQGLPRVFLVRSDDLSVVPVDGDGSTTIATDPWFAPDGVRLAYFYADEGQSGIRLLDLRDGSTTFFSLEGIAQWGHPSISPDGMRLAAQVTRGSRADIVAFDIASGEQIADIEAASETSFFTSPVWAGDDNAVVALVGERDADGGIFGGGVAEMGRISLDDGVVTMLTSDARPIGSTAWWPEADAVLVRSQTADATLVVSPNADAPIPTFELEVVASDSDAACRPIRGTLAACVRRNEVDQRVVTDIALIDLGDGALIRRLTTTPDVNEAAPSPSAVDARDLVPITPLSP